MNNIDVSQLRAWAEIDLNALRKNVQFAIKQAKGAGVMAVVKAGAYGHGLDAVCAVFEKEAIAFWAVANIGEARRIAAMGTKHQIFILGPTFPAEREEIIAQGWTCFVCDWQELDDFDARAQALGKKAKLHIALNSGMGRGGFLPEEICQEFDRLKQYSQLNIEGLGSHLPVADDDLDFTRQQIDCFCYVWETISTPLNLCYAHLSNSEGLLDYQIDGVNLVRPGLMLYGYDPKGIPNASLMPALTLKSRITAIQNLPVGHGISYGRTFVTQRPTRVATVGIGYADGYSRQVSGQGAEVWLERQQQRCSILGRVTMDQIMIDITDVNVNDCPEEGDIVELVGAHISAEEVARKANTIVWDILTGIGPRVTRVYKD